MFYQNNNDYMRDAFYYSTPQNSTYQNGYVNNFSPMNNMQTMGQNSAMPYNVGNNMMNNQNRIMQNQMVSPMMNNQIPNNMMTQANMQCASVSTMYPQVYRIINPVANRVISNSNYQCMTEDTLDNMVDTVYNIVEGDVSSLSSTMQSNSGDDIVTQGSASRGTTTNTNTTSTTNTGARQTSMSSESSRSSTTTISAQSTNRGQNQLLRDLIKIIIIKELLSRQRNCSVNNSVFSTNSNGFYDPRMCGMM